MLQPQTRRQRSGAEDGSEAVCERQQDGQHPGHCLLWQTAARQEVAGCMLAQTVKQAHRLYSSICLLRSLYSSVCLLRC